MEGTDQAAMGEYYVPSAWAESRGTAGSCTRDEQRGLGFWVTYGVG